MKKRFNRLIKLAVNKQLVFIALAVLLLLTGIYCLKNLDVEAYPDFTSPMVQVITQMPGKSAEDIERLATIPLEKELNGIPHEKKLYSISLFGLSVIKVVFDDGLPSSLIRQQVLERIYQTDLPEGVKPSLGPDASAIGEIYRYTLESDYYNPMTLKAVEDWQMEKLFKQVPGVISVNSFGGPIKTYSVTLDHEKVRFYNLDVGEIFDAIKASNSTAGGHYISNNDQAYIVRGLGLYSNIQSIENTVINSKSGIPIRVKDVAKVEIKPSVRIGQVGKNYNDDAVEGIVLMRKGENPTEVIKNLQKKLPEIKAQLPKGIHLVPFYERSELINNTMHTIGHNVVLGIVFVIIVLFAFILDLRITLIASLVIPLSLSFAFLMFKLFNIPANLLSMGAVDFGIIVDGAVILMENVFRALTSYKGEMTREKKESIIYKAVREVANVIVFSTLIILCCFMPIFAFDSVAGKLFHPLAFTMGFCLIGAVLAAVFLLPPIAVVLIPDKNLVEKENKMMAKLTALYKTALEKVFLHPKKFITATAAMFASAVLIFCCFLGSEFLPNLDEGNIWLRVTVLPRSSTIAHSVDIARQVREILLEYDEVKNVISHVGSADDGTDPNLLSNIENMVDLKLAKDWRRKWHKDKHKLINDMSAKLEQIPGITTYFTQYIQDNVEEAVSGSKGQVVLKIYGNDLYELQKLQDKGIGLLAGVKGVVDLSYDQIIGQPQYQIKVDRVKAGRYGLRSDDIQKVIEVAIGGKNATQVIENEKRFDVFVRLEQKDRSSLNKVQNVIVKTPEGISVPLSNVTEITTDNGAMIITRSENSRVGIIRFNIRGRDLGSTVKEAQKVFAKEMKLPEGYQMKWAGQSESQKTTNTRLAVILPFTLLVIAVILHINYKRWRYVLIGMSTIIVTLSGCIFALFVTKTYFSISAGVGLIAAIGVSIQNGVILLSSIIRQQKIIHDKTEALMHGALQKLRPVLTASLVAILGLLPAALSNGIGAQSQKPFAIAIIGGLSVGTVFTIFLIPLLFKITKEETHEVS
ncbi:MAG: CusA/CzcA family heavy metal efflux RND transporter [Candidatus Gastranaerophilales bacterium]|nr:CusA/CzcA family heavy metal efflux RND transporter [Candidatus Gastranaerophilales bacterium]